jgi:hypothetical protein
MKTIVAGALGLVLSVPAPSLAHQLDEYLQATRLSLTRDRVDLEIDLTPGAMIARDIASRLDMDADGRISPQEAEAYGQSVLHDVVVDLDGRAVLPTLTRVEVPPVEEMTEGVGTIQIRAVAPISSLAAGRRSLSFRNNHLPDGSVYLANALVSTVRDIDVVAQTRDPRQREIRVDYQVRPAGAIALAWSLVWAGMLATLVLFRRRGAPAVRSVRL